MRSRDAAVGRAVQRGERRARRRLHALDRGRPRARRRRHRGLDRPRPRPRTRRAPDATTRSTTLVAGLTRLADDGRGRDRLDWDPALEDVHLNLEAALAGPDRAGRRQAPHRSLAQRPGRHRPAALAAPRDRRSRRRAARLRARARRPRRARRDRGPARARPTSSRPSRSCSPITCSPTSRWPSATAAGWPTPGAAPTSRRSGSGALAGAGYPLDREATAAELGFDGVTRQLARRGQRPRFRGRDARPRSRSGWSTSAGWPRRSRGGRTRASGSSGVADAFSTGSSMMPNKKNPDPGRARPRPRRPRHRGADRGPDAAQGPPARLPARPPGETRRRCSTRSRSSRRRWA